jgi:hypothetical protein
MSNQYVYGKHKQLDHQGILHKAFFLSMYDVLCVYYYFFLKLFMWSYFFAHKLIKYSLLIPTT